MDVTVPIMTRTPGFALLRKLFGNPAVRRSCKRRRIRGFASLDCSSFAFVGGKSYEIVLPALSRPIKNPSLQTKDGCNYRETDD